MRHREIPTVGVPPRPETCDICGGEYQIDYRGMMLCEDCYRDR